MKAWCVSSHGGPEVLRRMDVEVPVAGPGEALIKVEAVGLNHLDLWVRNGVPGYQFPLPLTPGCDIAGTVESLGPGADVTLEGSGISVGTPVVVNPGVSCGRCEKCLSGFDPLCPRYGILGEHRDGGCADFVKVPVQNLIPRPAALSAEQAAALPIPFLTAWTMVFEKARVRPGETVLVQAGGSGVSVAAIQYCRMIGAQVITTVGEDWKIERAKALGADHVINYRKGPFRENLKKILSAQGKKGVEVVIEHVGGETFQESVKALGWGGRLVTCGATSGAAVQVDLKQVFFKNLSILGSTMGSKADLFRIVGLAASGRIHPVIDSVMSMDEYPKALEKLESRKAFGKIVVKN